VQSQCCRSRLFAGGDDPSYPALGGCTDEIFSLYLIALKRCWGCRRTCFGPPSYNRSLNWLLTRCRRLHPILGNLSSFITRASLGVRPIAMRAIMKPYRQYSIVLGCGYDLSVTYFMVFADPRRGQRFRVRMVCMRNINVNQPTWLMIDVRGSFPPSPYPSPQHVFFLMTVSFRLPC
jgi:hypothetical protein